MKWFRGLWCRVRGHVAVDLNVPLKTCRRCGHVETACAWCHVNAANAVARMGDKVEEVCWDCVGVP